MPSSRTASFLSVVSVLTVASQASADPMPRIARYLSATDFSSNTPQPSSFESPPPISYPRGAGTIPDRCNSGHTAILGTCWTPQVTNYPAFCAPDKEKDAGLCYTKCEGGYRGVGPVCWVTDLGMACDNLYTSVFDRSINNNRPNKVITYGIGAGVTAGASASVEYGAYYGANGEFGCYRSLCDGYALDIGAEAWASFGIYDDFDAFSGSDIGFEMGIGVGPLSVSYSDGAVVGQLSLGVSANPTPFSFGASTCDVTTIERKSAIVNVGPSDSCQSVVSKYGVTSSSWGSAPADVQDWWTRRGCVAGGVAFQAANGQYVAAENVGFGTINANRDQALGAETWSLVPLGGPVYAIRSYRGYYIAIHPTSNQAIQVTNTIGDREKFEMVNAPGGKTAFRSTFNGKYLHAVANGGSTLNTDGGSVGAAESFKMIDIRNSPSHDPCVPGGRIQRDESADVAKVCLDDPYCCDTAWDERCVEEVGSIALHACTAPNQLVYGKEYHLRNGYLSSPDIYGKETYLDTQGFCAPGSLCVMSGPSPDRDPGTKTGTWTLISAQGKAPGEPVRVGDQVYVRNEYSISPDINWAPTFLDTNGMCGPGSLCVRTSATSDRDPAMKTGTWTLMSANGKPPGAALAINDEVYLRNEYTASPDINGAPTFLDTNGSCGPHTLCVRTSAGPDRTGGLKTGVWRFEALVRRYGSSPSNPGRSCEDILNVRPDSVDGTYYINPDGGDRASSFPVRCDMRADGGGWTKVVHTSDEPTQASSGAVGSPSSAVLTELYSKHSDASINAIGGAGREKVYRIQGDLTSQKVYLQTHNTYIDAAQGMNLTAGTIQACEAPTLGECAMTNVTYPTIDTLQWGFVGNDAQRYFTDYSSPVTCDSGSPTAGRCWNAGVATDHQRLADLSIWVREIDNERAHTGNRQGNAGRTCKSIHSAYPDLRTGTYWIDPNEGSSDDAFVVLCDMELDGGGWAKLLHTPSRYLPTTGAYGYPYATPVTGFAKLSDAQINSIGGAGTTKTYRLVGQDSGNELYIRTNSPYIDTARAMNLTATTVQACSALSYSECSMTSITNPTIDSAVWGLTGNDCNRFFTDYAATATCGSPGAGPYRCFQAGVACGGHKLITAFSVWVREEN